MREKIVKRELLRPDAERQSSHLYDLAQMKDKAILEKELNDRMLFDTRVSLHLVFQK